VPITLIIDDEVAELLRTEIRRSGEARRTVANRRLRIALANAAQAPRKRVVVDPSPLGLPQGLSYDDVEKLLQALERLAGN
jgi:integrase